jgi:hypothetical protein
MAFVEAVQDKQTEVLNAVIKELDTFVCVRCKGRLLSSFDNNRMLALFREIPDEQKLVDLVVQEFDLQEKELPKSFQCSVCVGVLQDSVLDETISKLLNKLETNPYNAPQTVVGMLYVSLPVNTIIREYAIAAHLFSLVNPEL